MKVYSIIVCYHPKIAELTKLCEVLNQCNSIVILVDNSEVEQSELHKLPGLVIRPEENVGIAAAQNAGIHQALLLGAEIIVFFDQDSKITENFISKLIAPLRSGVPMVVGPVFFDYDRNFEFPSFRFNKLGLLEKVYSQCQFDPYPVDVIISSGSAATKEVFTLAGVMDEDFFIDYVDIEWTIRCRKKNIPVMVVPNASMKHSIGEKSISLGILTGFIHSPARSYYKVRNPFLLLRKKDIPVTLALKEILAALVHQALFAFFVKKKREYLQNYFMGILHGVYGITGKKR